MSAEVLPDYIADGIQTWAIVCDAEIPGGGYLGHVRKPGQTHAGKFVYPFGSSQENAEYALAEMEGQEP